LRMYAAARDGEKRENFEKTPENEGKIFPNLA